MEKLRLHSPVGILDDVLLEVVPMSELMGDLEFGALAFLITLALGLLLFVMLADLSHTDLHRHGEDRD